jgi:hypothetical protein
MITIEQPDPKISTCECCGNRTTTLLRFVHKDGDAYAVYYASFTEDHPDLAVQAIVSVGDWGEDSSPKDRSAFALRFRHTEDQYQIEVIDAADSPWREAETIGRKLSRDEALEHPRLQDVFHITDHIFADDEVLLSFFGHLRPDA